MDLDDLVCLKTLKTGLCVGEPLKHKQVVMQETDTWAILFWLNDR